MEANEIQIGDWVYSTFSKLPCKVTYLKLHESGYASVETTNVVGVKDIAPLSPIPLTPESLEKNGFKQIGEKFTRGEIDDDLIEIIPTINNSYRIKVSVADLMVSCSIWGSHVHQLQHALRLCGIEKEIIL